MMNMNSRERVLWALDRKAIDRVPYVETAIGIGVGEKLLNRKTPLVSIPQLGLNLRNVEDEKALSRLLQTGEYAGFGMGCGRIWEVLI
jgi:hypothetical protein